MTTDESTFEQLTQRHRRELHVHCYRMLASFDEAEDAVQETFLRAWRHREQFGGDSSYSSSSASSASSSSSASSASSASASSASPAPSSAASSVLTPAASSRSSGSSYRAWLYRIATNVCLDLLRSKARHPVDLHSFAEVPWLQPYPDRLLDEIAPAEDQPDAAVVARETIELAFLAALQVLPPRQRAALVLRDVLGQPANETAALLDTSVAAANSALQRARATMQAHLPSHRLDWSATDPSPAERELLDQFIDAHERCDARAALEIAATDLRITMPPYQYRYDGLEVISALLERAFGPDRDGDWRLVPTMANRMPTAASYLRRPGDTEFRAFKFDVLRIEGDQIAEITTFGTTLFPAFGLPLVLAR